MNIQEAYNKGLTDAEQQVISKLLKLLDGEEYQPFANPKLNDLIEIVEIRSTYYRELADRNNNVGKGFKKKVAEQKEILDKVKA